MTEIPPPPQEPLSTHSLEIDGMMDDFRRRIAELEAEREDEALSAEAEHSLLLRREVRQRIRMRYAAVGISTAVIIMMACFALHSLNLYFVGPFVLISPSLAIAMFLAPIISITTVTIMFLLGAFRRFKDDDIEKINAQAVIESTKAVTGN